MNRTDSTVTMRLAADSASYIDFKYAMHNDTYLVDFTIDAVGMANKLANTDYVDIEWSQRARQIEKGYTYENRLAELTYKLPETEPITCLPARTMRKKWQNAWTGLLSRTSSSLPYSSPMPTLRKRS